jgi:hypothetical protein
MSRNNSSSSSLLKIPRFVDAQIPKVQSSIMKRKNIIGVGSGLKITNGITTNEPCIIIFVKEKLDKSKIGADDLIPSVINNVKTDVIGVGKVFAGMPKTAELQTLNQRVRPAMAGFSIGHFQITAGTIGTYVYDASLYPGIPTKYYVLSNNHVLANSNNAKIGDPILQPGPADGGKQPGDIFARLSKFTPIKFISGSNKPSNMVDAAIAEVDIKDALRDINWIGSINGINITRQVGDIVMKTGRTTNFTTGKILSTNGTIDVDYGGGRVARFTNQIITSAMSAGGDSGSLIVDTNKKAVGLLFAGSDSITIINKIYYVEKLLSIKVWP